MADVNEHCTLSPGKFLHSHAASMDNKRKRRQEYAATKEGKRDRLQLKELKLHNRSSNEGREGPTYGTSVALAETRGNDVDVIPAAILQPKTVQIPQ